MISTPSLTIVRFPEYEDAVASLFRRAEHRAAFDETVDALIAADPTCGDRIPGTGGFRKVRVARPDQKSGARGGARVIYYYVAAAGVAYLFTAYAKSVTDDLTPRGKRVLRDVARALDAHRAR